MMNPPPKVSVLMSVYNDGPYLAQALDCLLAQTFDNFEVIVIGDGALPNTVAVIQDYAARDTRIKPHFQGQQGLTKSLNRAAGYAQGPYYARMDGDDLCTPERFARQVAVLDQHPSVGFVASYFSHMDATGTTIRAVTYTPYDDASLRPQFWETNPICHGSVMMRREAFDQAGGYRPVFTTTQDYDLWLRLLDQWEIAMVPELLYHHRVHPHSVTVGKRLVQMQFKRLAQVLSQQRRDRQGADDLQQLSDFEAQQAYIRQFFQADLRTHGREYSRILRSYGQRHLKNQEWQAAVETLWRAWTLSPGHWEGLHLLGHAWWQKHRHAPSGARSASGVS